MRSRREGAINNDLAFDSQPIGWSVVGAALQNHSVGARDAYGPGNSYRSRSSAGQLRLVDCWDDCSSQRQHKLATLSECYFSISWASSWQAGPLPFLILRQHETRCFSWSRPTQHRRANSAGKASLAVEIRPAEKIVGVIGLRASSSLTRTRDISWKAVASTQLQLHLKADQRNLGRSHGLRWLRHRSVNRI